MEVVRDDARDGTCLRLTRYGYAGDVAPGYHVIEGGGRNCRGADIGSGPFGGTVSEEIDARAMMGFFGRHGL